MICCKQTASQSENKIQLFMLFCYDCNTSEVICTQEKQKQRFWDLNSEFNLLKAMGR